MNKIIYSLIAFCIVTGTMPVVQAEAPTPAPIIVKDMTVEETISYYAELYGASEKELRKVAYCESSFNPQAIGDHGHAKNVMQFHEPTFDYFSQEMGVELTYNSYNDQIRLASWMFGTHPETKKHWTCAKITGVI